MSPEEEIGDKNAIYSGHPRLCQQPRAAHALHSDQQNKEQELKSGVNQPYYLKYMSPLCKNAVLRGQQSGGTKRQIDLINGFSKLMK
jgi:hypothetical protein